MHKSPSPERVALSQRASPDPAAVCPERHVYTGGTGENLVNIISSPDTEQSGSVLTMGGRSEGGWLLGLTEIVSLPAEIYSNLNKIIRF